MNDQDFAGIMLAVKTLQEQMFEIYKFLGARRVYLTNGCELRWDPDAKFHVWHDKFNQNLEDLLKESGSLQSPEEWRKKHYPKECGVHEFRGSEAYLKAAKDGWDAASECWPLKDSQGKVIKGVMEGPSPDPLRGDFKGILEGVSGDRIDKLEAIAAEDKPNQPVQACTPGARRTSAEWQELMSGTIVVDPDGWDRTNYVWSWNIERITLDQYLARRARSTCRNAEVSKYTAARSEGSRAPKFRTKGKMAYEIFRKNCVNKNILLSFEKSSPRIQQKWSAIEEEIEKAIADRKIESVVG